MSRSRPPLLPGKVLEPFHLDPIETLGLSNSALTKELQPLLELAEKNLWINKDEKKQLENWVKERGIDKVFDRTAFWHEKLNPKEEAHSRALAGWILIQNIRAMERKKKLFQKPFQGLKVENGFILRKRVIEAIEISIKENSTKKYDELISRHFLSLVICQKMISSNFLWGPQGKNNVEGCYGELKRYMLGHEIYKGDPQDHSWTLSPAYGFMRNGKWLMPPVERVKKGTSELWNTLVAKDKTYLKSVEERILS